MKPITGAAVLDWTGSWLRSVLFALEEARLSNGYLRREAYRSDLELGIRCYPDGAETAANQKNERRLHRDEGKPESNCSTE